MVRPKQENEEIELLVDRSQEDIENAFDDLPSSSAIINLYRMRDHGRPPWIGKMSPAEFDLAYIEERWGGGRYKAIAKDVTTGDKIERDFEIEGEPRISNSQNPNLIKKQGEGRGFWLSKEEMDQLSNKSIQPLNGDSSIERRMARLEVLLEKFTDRGNGGEDKLLEKLAKYREIFMPVQSIPQSQIDLQSVIGVFKEGIQAAMSAERGEDSSPILMLIEKIMPFVQDVFSKMAQSTQPQPSPRQVNSIQPQQPPEAPTGFLSLAPMIRPYLVTFIDAASVDDDPGLLVPLVAKRIPPDKHQVVMDWLQGSGWFTDLCSLDQRIAFQRAWWNEFIDQLKGEIAPASVEPEPEPESTEE